MSVELSTIVTALNRRFLLDYPRLAAARIEQIPIDEAAEALAEHGANVLVPLMTQLAPDIAVELIERLPDAVVNELLAEVPPNDAAQLVASLHGAARERRLGALDPAVAQEIRRILTYPHDSAGRLMVSRVPRFRESTTVAATLGRLRETRVKTARSLFIVDDENRLSGRVSIQEIALATPHAKLAELAQPIRAVASPVAPREEVVELLERFELVDLPVVDVEGRLLGIVYHDRLIQAIQEDASVDIQTMVGASKDERALSGSIFSVRKRMPWLQINLMTAFLASAVIGLFEHTLEKVVALAVLMPIVASMGGVAGSQTLTVVIRGMALGQIGRSNLRWLLSRELISGALNGILWSAVMGGIAALWFGDLRIALIIIAAMVINLITAALAGTILPVALRAMRIDPALAGGVALTTVTDVVGFMSFLGLATWLFA